MFPGLLELDLERNSLYDLLAHRYGTQVARALEAIEPVLLPAREARLLDVPRRTPALAVEGVAYSSAGVAVELGRSYVRSDRTRYYVERAVHRASWVRQLAPFPSASAPGDGSRPGAQTKATRVGNPAA
jgi:GntR family transcriptional regulator